MNNPMNGVLIGVLLSALFTALPANANTGKGGSESSAPPVSDVIALNQPASQNAKSDFGQNLVIKSAPETPADKAADKPHDKTGDNSPALQQKNPETAATDAAVTKDQTPALPSAPLGISYKSNDTAIKAIDRNISLFKDRIKERFSIWLERSAKYMEIMKDILKEKGMPEDLVFLPFVESGFNVNAYSRARAVGPWQFIASTGKRYGLVIDWWRDERKDPVKSTQAAADYLKDLYGMFGSWKLALAAYNAGEGRISKAMKKSGAEDYWALLHTKQIRSETKEYVPRYIAASMIASMPEEYGFQNLVYHEPLEYDTVTLNFPLDIEIIAQCTESTVQEIKELNPELRRWSTPPNVPEYTIRIPFGTKETFIENLEQIPEEKRFSFEVYKAKKGDTLKNIAKKADVPLAAILAMNGMSGIEKIDAGEDVRIPPKGKYFADPDDRASARKASYAKTAGKKKSGKAAKKTSAKSSNKKAPKAKAKKA
jgi:membrane-bound lytic murein transglycosylase D